jgi:hypothetical protein
MNITHNRPRSVVGIIRRPPNMPPSFKSDADIWVDGAVGPDDSIPVLRAVDDVALVPQLAALELPLPADRGDAVRGAPNRIEGVDVQPALTLAVLAFWPSARWLRVPGTFYVVAWGDDAGASHIVALLAGLNPRGQEASSS